MYFELIRIIANFFLLVNRWEEKRNANACPFIKTSRPLCQADCERNVNMEANAQQSFLDLADITYLTPENAVFSRTKNGFPVMRAFLPPVTDDLTEEKLPPQWQDFGRVQFHRAFPFDTPDEYISVLNMDGKEYGIIRSLADFAGEAGELIQKELARKYLSPAITKILSLKDKLGFSYWEVETDHGKKSFTMQDTYRNMFKNSENGVVLTDVDGNRYVIKDVLQLDAKSYRKIELYL